MRVGQDSIAAEGCLHSTTVIVNAQILFSGLW